MSGKFSEFLARLGFLLKRNDLGVPGDFTLWADWGGSLLAPSLTKVDAKTSGVGFRAMVAVTVQVAADGNRTVSRRTAANLDPKTRLLRRVKVGRGRAFTAVMRNR